MNQRHLAARGSASLTLRNRRRWVASSMTLRCCAALSKPFTAEQLEAAMRDLGLKSPGSPATP
jgi:hypothetical protein